MTPPSSQRYVAEGRRNGIDESILESAAAIIERLARSNSNLAPIFTLRHLSELTEVSYGYLRSVIAREKVQYRSFVLKKRIPGRSRFRSINTPLPPLMEVQQWISRNILRHTKPAPVSFAYHPNCSPVFAALAHRECEWLLKIDIEDFFHNIGERQVFAVFHRLGYPRLLSFELARLTTFIPEHPKRVRSERWPAIENYRVDEEGVLPQGAPTSPMLSNLAMLDLDARLTGLAEEYGMRYTRYADDLAFSCRENKSRPEIEGFQKLVLKELSAEGFRHNRRKTVIRGPGTRRIVLGILVDGREPRLAPDFKDMLRMHLHYLKSPGGPPQHAKKRKTSVSALFYHIRGLIGWAVLVEPDYGASLLKEFESVRWPPIQPRDIEPFND